MNDSSNGHNGRKVFRGGDMCFDSHDFVRIVLQSLSTLGYHDTVKCLEAESGLKVHSHSIEVFFQSLLSGDWDASFTSMQQITFDNKSHDDIKGIILEFKFIERLQQGNIMEALTCLRTELSTKVSKSRLSILSTCLICPDNDALDEVCFRHSIPMSRDMLLQSIRHHISPHQMVSKHRLETLLLQAIQFQSSQISTPACSSVLATAEHPRQCSLLQDLVAADPKLIIPSNTCYVLEDHADEIWCISLSHDGVYLATASVDGCVKLWNCLTLPPQLISSSHPASPDHSPLRLSWNHSHRLLGSFQGLSEVFCWEVGEHVVENVIVSTPGPVLCALWLENDGNEQFYVSASSEFTLCLYGNDECLAYLKEDSHIEDAQVLPPPHRLSTDIYRDVGWTVPSQPIVTSHADRSPLHSRILIVRNTSTLQLFSVECTAGSEDSPYKYRFVLEDEMKLDVPIVCLGSNYSTIYGGTSDVTASYMTLLTLYGGDLLSILVKGNNEISIMQTYRGMKQSRFKLYASIGGGGNSATTLASGNEDSNVYVWTHNGTAPCATLKGHAGAVNAVAWSPRQMGVLFTGSDDSTVRVWVPEDYAKTHDMKKPSLELNGVHEANRVYFLGDGHV